MKIDTEASQELVVVFSFGGGGSIDYFYAPISLQLPFLKRQEHRAML